VLVPLAPVLGIEKDDGAEPVAPPNRPPEAGAVDVVDWPEVALDAGAPNVKDILAARCDELLQVGSVSAAEQAKVDKRARWDGFDVERAAGE
jgi:hypothetical protein